MRERDRSVLADLIHLRALEEPDLAVLTFEHLSLDGGTGHAGGVILVLGATATTEALLETLFIQPAAIKGLLVQIHA